MPALFIGGIMDLKERILDTLLMIILFIPFCFLLIFGKYKGGDYDY